MFHPSRVELSSVKVKSEAFLRVKRLDGVLYEVTEPGTKCDLYVSGIPLMAHHAYFITGFEYKGEYFYTDVFIDQHEAHRELFELNRRYSENRLAHVQVVVGDISGVVSFDKITGYRPTFFIKHLTLL